MEQSLPAPKESTTAWTQLPGDFQRGELHTHRGAEVVQTHLSPRSQRCSGVGSSAMDGTGSRMWLPLASAACRKAGMGSCKIIGTAVFINFSLLFFFLQQSLKMTEIVKSWFFFFSFQADAIPQSRF